jgi:hypothetical protein
MFRFFNTEDIMASGWLDVAKEALKIPGLLVEVYGDLAKPGVRQVGKALDTVLGLGNTILWPILWANERSRVYLEKNLLDYCKRLEHLPVEKVVCVAPEIGVPIAEKLAYVGDEKLSDLYVTLLAKASDIDTVSQAHPSFINVINNLSPDDAQLLEFFVNNDDIEFVTAKWHNPELYSIAWDLLIAPNFLSGLTFPQNVPAYINNLAGLGLVSIHRDRTVYKSDVYAILEEYWTIKFPKELAPEADRELVFEGGVISITEFGSQFIATCHNK